MRRMLTLITAAAATSAALSPASARPFTPGMSCGAAASIVAQNGAIVLSTSPTTYDRYVFDRRFCSYGEHIEPAYVQTRETPACLIGYTCVSRELDLLFRR
jgi:hypothetical protein